MANGQLVHFTSQVIGGYITINGMPLISQTKTEDFIIAQISE